MEPVYHLFVYGSLRKGFQSDAYQYISRYFKLCGSAKVKGILFDLGPYPAAVPGDNGHFIVGELYTIAHKEEFSWALEQLDDYEGLNVEEGEPVLYKRELAEVYTGQETVISWIYWFNGESNGYPIIESGDELEYMQQKNQ